MKLKKTLLIAAVAALLLCVFGVTVFAETEGIFTYSVTDGEATVTNVSRAGLEEIVIPDTLGGYPVTKLAKGLLSGPYARRDYLLAGDFTATHPLKRVYLPDGIKELPDQLFLYQCALEEVRLPADLETIGQVCFSYCVSLKHIDFPDTLVSVKSGAFCDSWALEEAVFPEGLRSLGTGSCGAVFAYTPALRYVYLPESITNIYYMYSNEVYEGQTVSFSDIYYGGTEEQFNSQVTTARISWVTYHFNADRAALLWREEPESPYDVSFTDGILTVSGDGPLTADEAQPRPWDEWREQTKTLVLDGGVTQVGCDVFAGFPELANVIARADGIVLSSHAFSDCPALTNVILLGGGSIAADAFADCGEAPTVFAENVSAPAGAGWDAVSVSYAEDTLTYDGSLSQNAYDFFDVLSVFCDHYGTIDRLSVNGFSFYDVALYYYNPDTGRRTRINGELENGEIYPQIERDGETVSVSFNELCAGVADGSVTDFYIVINDEAHPETEKTSVRIVDRITGAFQKILRTIVTLLNKLFRLLNTFKKN